MNNRAKNKLKRRDERRLIKFATNAISSDFHNPDRFACPDTSALKAIVHHDLSAPNAEDLIDHIATCAPCFEQYRRQRHWYLLQRRGGIALACLAVGIAIGAAWHYVQPGRGPGSQSASQHAPEPILTATLDFQNRTAERSGESHPIPEAELPRLRRALLRLTIKLPLGTDDGAYDIRVWTSEHQSVVSATGNVAWDGSAETLATTIDLRRLVPGKYTLALHSNNSTWRTYSIVLE